jgi:putative addiction module component (TIGR02574 family)
MDFSSTLARIRTMSIDERIRLVQAIWDEIAAERGQESISDAQECELERRLADDDANPDPGIPWDEIRAEARARSQR